MYKYRDIEFFHRKLKKIRLNALDNIQNIKKEYDLQMDIKL